MARVSYARLLQLPQDHHFFLFGARNTGKSTLIESQFDSQHTLFIDLLEDSQLQRFSEHPDRLKDIVAALPTNITHVVIDEIQKVPALLNIVQLLMRKTSLIFIMTGSSARKLKKGGANLLAGRAFVYHLYPLSINELKDDFDLTKALQWGTLPEIFHLNSDEHRERFLQAYSHTYLKEEIWEEQHIKKLEPFRKFLEVAAQSNANIINYSNIAKDVGVDNKTIKNYFSILEDTLIGFFLEPYHTSMRKRLHQAPKFYFFDTGVVRSLTYSNLIPVRPRSSPYGEFFEHFILLECMRLNEYYHLNYRFSYLKTHSGAEIDLIIERPNKPLLCIEIKSTDNIATKNLKVFSQLASELGECEKICLCQEHYPQKKDNILVLPWQEGLKRYFQK